MLSAGSAAAFQEIPVPDTSATDKNVIQKQKELIDTLNREKDKLTGVKLGSLYGQLGMFYQAHEYFISAKVAYRNALEASPYDFRWSYLLAFILSNEGQFEEAIKLYEKVLDIDSDYLPAKIRIADLKLESGEFAQSETLYKQVLDKDPEFAKALVGLGKINMQNGKPKQAIDYFNKALKIQPLAKQLNYLISQGYYALGDEKQAKIYQDRKTNRSVSMYDKILQEMRLHSVSAVYYSHAAINSFLQGDYKLAEELILHSIKLNPDEVNFYFTLMNIYNATDRTKKAIELGESLIKKYPDNSQVYYSLGVMNEIAENDKAALKWYNKVSEMNPNNIRSVLASAKTHMRMKEYNKALLDLRKYQKLDEANPYPKYLEASILSYLKVCDKSLKMFNEAIKQQPENMRYLVAFVKTVASCDYVGEDDMTNALNAARNMYRLAPNISVTQSLAMIEAKAGNFNDAVDYQAQVLFDALMQKIPEDIVEDLKKDFEQYKKRKSISKGIKVYDIDINPARVNSIEHE